MILKTTADELKKIGSPYSFVPLGCTMICRLDAYIGVGGMNTRKAAEDNSEMANIKLLIGLDHKYGQKTIINNNVEGIK